MSQMSIFDQLDRTERRPYRSSSQWVRVLGYMKRHGAITQLEASEKLGVARLAARIPEIVSRGYEVDTEMVTVINRHGQRVRVACYKYRGRRGGEA